MRVAPAERANPCSRCRRSSCAGHWPSMRTAQPTITPAVTPASTGRRQRRGSSGTTAWSSRAGARVGRETWLDGRAGGRGLCARAGGRLADSAGVESSCSSRVSSEGICALSGTSRLDGLAPVGLPAPRSSLPPPAPRSAFCLSDSLGIQPRRPSRVSAHGQAHVVWVEPSATVLCNVAGTAWRQTARAGLVMSSGEYRMASRDAEGWWQPPITTVDLCPAHARNRCRVAF